MSWLWTQIGLILLQLQKVLANQYQEQATLVTISKSQASLLSSTQAVNQNLGTVINQGNALLTALDGYHTDTTALLNQVLSNQQTILNNEQHIVALLTPPVVTGIVVIFEKGEHMSKTVGASIDIQVPEDGSQNATAIIGFVDKNAFPTQPVAGATVATVATMSNPALVATVDPTGLNITIAPSVPPVAATGVTLSVSVTITNPDGTTIGPLTATGTPALDVTGGAVAAITVSEA